MKEFVAIEDLNEVFADFKRKLNGYVLRRAKEETLRLSPNKAKRIMAKVLDIYKQRKLTNKILDDILKSS
ncbi:MAG: hypothetical protein JW873_04780 [Candidatus Saganbacteria bacterium]|nr:hypothetical protein [Candidatus Saganbacteria bacterium]